MNDNNSLPPDARRRTLLILWAAMVSSVVLYCVLAVIVSQSRTGLSGPFVLPDYLDGMLTFLPYLLPLLLFPVGAAAYQRLALKGVEPSRFGGRPKTHWGAVQTGFIAMLAIFEVNVLVGLVFFFLGSPLAKFLPFAVGTVALDVIALRRLMDTWPVE